MFLYFNSHDPELITEFYTHLQTRLNDSKPKLGSLLSLSVREMV